MNKKESGDEAEHFVADYLSDYRYKCEIHPRTYKILHLPDGRTIVVSRDNDYHNSFDVKAEGYFNMIYAQVKLMPGPTVSSGHISDAMQKIDKNYPYNFPYQRIQVWMVWKEWVKQPRRHKEFKFRVWERHLHNGSFI
ncbi:hypothetical protein SE19_09165, partial [Acidiplasma aeolicum]